MSEPTLPISVVIPAYRRPEMVARALRSVAAQIPAPAEVIVIDDASGDETGARARSFGARVVTHAQNLGEGGARNTGLRVATHDWVALLDCDDEWLPGHLWTVWSARDGHVLIGSAALGAGDRPEDHRVYGWTGRRARRLRGPADVAVPENKFAPSAVLLRREPALTVGGFRVGMPRAADLDLWVRLLERGTGVALPRVTALYHRHGGQVSADAGPMWAAHRSVLERYADREWCTEVVLRRHQGVVAWDATRAALAQGEATLPTLCRLSRELRDPRRLWGLAELLHERHRGRRHASRLMPGAALARSEVEG